MECLRLPLSFGRNAASTAVLALVLVLPDFAASQPYESALAAIEGEPLSLDEAIRRALDLGTASLDADAALRAASGASRRERGAFDPILFAELDVVDENTPSSSPFTGADVLETKQTAASSGARITLPFGTELEARLTTTRFETNSSFAALDPEYASQARLNLRQPLLKGLGPGTSAERDAAVRQWEAARARRTDAKLAVVANVTATYWDLYAAERDLAVQQLIVERATVFLNEAEKREAAGLVGPSEVATARVFLAEQQLAELDREERLGELSDRLASLVGRPPAKWVGRYHPTTEPRSDFTVESEEALQARALESNGELRAARRELAAADAARRGAKWNALPALDVLGSLGGNGLSGTSQPVSFGEEVTMLEAREGAGPSIEDAIGGEHPRWSVGVLLEFPLGLREGSGERERLAAEVARAEQRVIEIERGIQEEVRARHRELTHGVRRLELAQLGVEASSEQVRVGQIEYENGRSTAFELVRLGADLAAAQERYSSALVATAKAAAELERLAPSAESLVRWEEGSR